jgi:hypothetical protein
MENKNGLFFVVLLLLVSVLGAQEYYLDRNDGETRFIQRLTWQADEFVLRYEVVIEEKVGMGTAKEEPDAAEKDEAAWEKTVAEEVFLEVLREFTRTAFIEFSLPPGIYRYKVTIHDLLDRPGEASEWVLFEIIQALEPELHNFFPTYFHLDKDGPWILNLTGLNLSPDAEVYLHRAEKDTVIVPLEYSGNTELSSARLIFDVRQLVPGNYEIYMKNPGGLDTSAGTFEIGFHKSPSIYIEAAYTPLIPIYGKLDQLDNSPIFPLGAAFRLGFVPLKKSWGHLGVELTASWNYLSSGSGSDKESFNILGAEAAVLYQKWLSNRIMAISFRAGAGLAGTANMLLPQAETGGAFLWLFHKPFFMEGGIDYIHRLTDTTLSPGYLRPWLGLGIKL